MNYLVAIKTAVIVFPILALVITGPFILHQYHKFASIEPLKTIIIYGFIFYLLCLLFHIALNSDQLMILFSAIFIAAVNVGCSQRIQIKSFQKD